MRGRATLAAAVVALAAGGCGSARHPQPRAAGAPRARGTTSPRRGRRAARGDRRAAVTRASAEPIYWASPRDAVRAFAEAFINWTPSTVEVDLQDLAVVSRGTAHAEMTQEAGHVAGDYELQRGGIANHGEVESIAPLPGRRDRYIVVTLEQTTATDARAYQDLPPAWHVIVAGTIEVLPGQWTVSAWQEES